MSSDLLQEITVFVLAVFVGFEVISKVPTMLHTPLMSGTNAIHGIVLLGGLLVLQAAIASTQDERRFDAAILRTLGAIAIAIAIRHPVGAVECNEAAIF